MDKGERPWKTEGECHGGSVWPKVAQAWTENTGSPELKASNSVLLHHFSCVERVAGIEPALSAWGPTLVSPVCAWRDSRERCPLYRKCRRLTVSCRALGHAEGMDWIRATPCQWESRGWQ
jgi:hypothetical protein